MPADSFRPPVLRDALRALALVALPLLPTALLLPGDRGTPQARQQERPGFVGSATCAGCHAAEYAD
jgi:cytochrome c553